MTRKKFMEKRSYLYLYKMKNILLAILLLALYFAPIHSYSQSFTVIPSHSITATVQSGDYVTSVIYFENHLTEPLNLKWDLLEKITPVGWDYSYCDYNTCYDATYQHGTMAPIDTASSGFLKVNVMTTTESWSYFSFRVYNAANESDADTVEFWFNGLTSVVQIDVENSVDLYPNPVERGSLLTLSGTTPIQSIVWFSEDGKMLEESASISLPSNQIEVPQSPGTQYLLIDTDQGKWIKKIIIR
jgi:hypothetical protein